MTTDPSPPRISSNQFQQFQGRSIRFVGKVLQDTQTAWVLQSPDQHSVQVHRRQPPASTMFAPVGSALEVIATVESDFSLNAMTASILGQTCSDEELQIYGEMVQRLQNFPELF